MAEIYGKDLLIIAQIVTNMMRMFGFVLIIPAIVAAIMKDYTYLRLFFMMAIIIIAVFSIIKKFLRQTECKMKHAVIAISIGWIIMPLISSIPFMVNQMSFVDSFFESTSGWSTTGLTMIKEPSMIPGVLNFYRGFIQWVGGFGIVVLALLFFEKPKTAQALFLAEGRFEDFYVDFSKIARVIVLIYATYTFFGVLAFLLAGVPLLDAIVHTMTSIATGGFSSNNIGVGLYGKIPMLITILLMYIGGISFLTHYRVFKGNIKKLFNNPEVKFMLILTVIATIIVGIDLFKAHKSGYYDGFFYVVSAITSTGNSTPITVDSYPPLSIFVFMLLMLCGATYGSTGGGLKIWRIMIILKGIKREIMKYFYPTGTILQIKMGSHVITDEDSLRAGAFVFLYLALLAIGTAIFVFAGYNTVSSFFLVSSAQGNVGLNIVTENYFNMGPFLKLLLTFHMFLGRLEIIPFVVMLRSIVMVRR